MRKLGIERSGIEGITFIHDFRDESIGMCAPAGEVPRARARICCKVGTHTRAAIYSERVVARILLRGLPGRSLSLFIAAGIWNVNSTGLSFTAFKFVVNNFCALR